MTNGAPTIENLSQLREQKKKVIFTSKIRNYVEAMF